MQKSLKSTQFVRLLKKLTADEQSDFLKHARHLHSGQKIPLAVLDYICQLGPEFNDDKKLNSSAAGKKIFKDKEGNNSARVLNSLPDLRKWLEEYLLMTKATNGSVEQQMLWANILVERGLNDEFYKLAKNLRQRILEKEPVEDKCFNRSLELNLLNYQHSMKNSQWPNIQFLEQGSHDLANYYLTAQLKIACEIANVRRRRASSQEQAPPMEPLFYLPQLDRSTMHPLPRLYAEVYELLSKEEAAKFSQTIQLLKKHIAGISQKETHTIFSYLHNFAASQVRLGEERQLSLLHQLNVFGVENGVFMDKDLFTLTQFDNIIMVACRVGDLKWANAFLKNHLKFMPDSVQENAELFAKANIAYSKTELPKCIKLLEKIKPADFYNNVRIRTLMLQCQYEVDEKDFDMVSYCTALEVQLEKYKKQHQQVVRAMLNTVRIIKMLYRRRSGKQTILQEIDAAKQLYLKEWLISKANQL